MIWANQNYLTRTVFTSFRGMTIDWCRLVHVYFSKVSSLIGLSAQLCCAGFDMPWCGSVVSTTTLYRITRFCWNLVGWHYNRDRYRNRKHKWTVVHILAAVRDICTKFGTLVDSLVPRPTNMFKIHFLQIHHTVTFTKCPRNCCGVI